MTSENIKNLLGGSIYQRALSYYQRGRVHNYEEIESAPEILYITANVTGTQTYDTCAWINSKDFSFRSASCDCAFNEQGYGEPCKHIGALLFKFNELHEFTPKQNLENLMAEKSIVTAATLPETKQVETSNYHRRVEELFGNKWKAPEAESDKNASILLERYTSKPVSKALEIAQSAKTQIGDISLLVEFSPDPFRRDVAPEIRIKIGNGRRFYIVKDIIAMLSDIDEKNYVSYGKQLAFTHSLETFDEFSQRLLKILYKQRSFYDYAKENKRGYNRYSSYNPRVGSLAIAPPICDEIYNLHFEKGEIYIYNLPRTPFKLTLQAVLKKGGATLSVSPRVNWFYGEDYIYTFDDENIWRLDKNLFNQVVNVLETLTKEVFFTTADVSKFCSYVLPEIRSQVVLDDPDEILISQIPLTPIVQYYIDAPNYRNITAYPVFLYGEDKVSPLEQVSTTFMRDKRSEEQTIALLAHYMHHTKNEHNSCFFSVQEDDDIYRFFEEALPDMLATGEVYMSDVFRKMQAPQPSIKVGISVANSVLDLKIDTGEFPVEELKALLATLRSKKKYHRLKDGRLLKTDNSMNVLEELSETLSLAGADIGEGDFTLPLYRAPSLDKAFSGQDGFEFRRDEAFRQISRNFRSVADNEYALPKSLQKVLRKYQRTGYRWLRTLDAYGMGGILADDMGLGKTLQVLAYLLSLKEKGEKSPSLIVCPASLLLNWVEEAQKFTPELQVLAIDGNAHTRAELVFSFAKVDVVVTSYDYLRRDVELYEDFDFHACIIDEAQAIKNHNTQKYKAVCKVKSEVRFALTGTPIENRLSELWSVFSFLMPGYLYPYAIFREEFERPIVQQQDANIIQRLNHITSPFILRRMKIDVLKELPPKIENLYHVFFTQEQKKLYQASVLEAKERLSTLKAEDRIQVFAVLTKLRQICCDPRLNIENWQGGSAKLDACAELISSAVDAGHKVLLFSQFTSMLDLLAVRLDEIGVTHFTLQGSTPKPRRAQLVHAFNDGEADVFLISLKAGGTGLNLTAADIVIHYDPWWNVAAQNQATDRAYRIGQQNTVQVYKLIMQGSIEEKIMEMQIAKQDLANIITGNEGAMLSMSPSDILALLDE